jgi:hypothetical protein
MLHLCFCSFARAVSATSTFNVLFSRCYRYLDRRMNTFHMGKYLWRTYKSVIISTIAWSITEVNESDTESDQIPWSEGFSWVTQPIHLRKRMALLATFSFIYILRMTALTPLLIGTIWKKIKICIQEIDFEQLTYDVLAPL